MAADTTVALNATLDVEATNSGNPMIRPDSDTRLAYRRIDPPRLRDLASRADVEREWFLANLTPPESAKHRLRTSFSDAIAGYNPLGQFCAAQISDFSSR